MNTETELRVVAMLDGKPGHEKQTLGIVQALQQLIKVHLTRVTLKPQSPVDTVLAACALVLPGVNVKDPAPGLANCDLVIGAGSHTHLPLLHHKKKYRPHTVTCMSPAIHLRHLFDICFVPEHDGVKEGGGVIHTVGAPNMSINRNIHQNDKGLILLGGVDEKSHYWQSESIVAMVEKVIQENERMRWTLASSPRTPDETVNSLHSLAARFNQVKFCDYRDTPKGWVEEQYDESGVVWVSSDSISMIYEALSAGCAVGIIPMRWKRKNCKFRRNETMLVERGLVTRFSFSGGNDITGKDSCELNEALRCAKIILKRWWPDSLR
ncbi:MAG: mitochondrial fission ELM1 family protein [Desulforhopalus sp.]